MRLLRRSDKRGRCHTGRRTEGRAVVNPSDDRSPGTRTPAQQWVLVSQTACALAESPTLADATPRMLRAICQTLGWEFGALWRINPASQVRLLMLPPWTGPRHSSN